MQDVNCLRQMLERRLPESPIYVDCTPPIHKYEGACHRNEDYHRIMLNRLTFEEFQMISCVFSCF